MSKWIWASFFVSLGVTLGTSAVLAETPSPAPVVLMAPATPPTTQPAPPPDAAARQAQEAQCTARDAAACFTLGTLYRDGTGVPQARTMANSYFRRACALGHEAGCSAMSAPAPAQNLGVPPPPMRDRDALTATEVAETLTMLDNTCRNDRVGSACFAAGTIRAAGDAPIRDRTEARRLLTRGCDLRDANSCALLAVLEHVGEGGPRDQAAAQRHQRRALEIEPDNKIATQFTSVVQSLNPSSAEPSRHNGLARRTQEALQPYRAMAQSGTIVAVLEQRCAEADQRACVLFGASFLQGGQRSERGEALVKTGCEAGDTLGCLFLAAVQSAREDRTAARASYENACTRNDSLGCALYAGMLAAGMGGPADSTRAQAMAQRAIEIDFADPVGHEMLTQIRRLSSAAAELDR